MWYSNNPLENISKLLFQIELFKKAGWTVIQPPVPLIPDGTVTLPSLRIPRVLFRVLICSNIGTVQGLFSCFRSPTVDVFQVAVHECPDAGWETCDGGCQWDIDSEDVWKAGYVLTHFYIHFKGNYCATSQGKWRFHLKQSKQPALEKVLKQALASRNNSVIFLLSTSVTSIWSSFAPYSLQHIKVWVATKVIARMPLNQLFKCKLPSLRSISVLQRWSVPVAEW